MDKFIAGIGVGLVVAGVTLATLPASLAKQANETIKECEQSLPRDRHCKLVALPIIP